jgi:hypothetical protein
LPTYFKVCRIPCKGDNDCTSSLANKGVCRSGVCDSECIDDDKCNAFIAGTKCFNFTEPTIAKVCHIPCKGDNDCTSSSAYKGVCK